MTKKFSFILKRLGLLCVDVAMFAFSVWVSSKLVPSQSPHIMRFGVALIVVKIILSARFGLYHALLRFAGLPLASAILRVTSIAFVLGVMAAQVPALKVDELGFFVLDFLLSSFFIGVIRFAPRYLDEVSQPKGSKRVLIYGAGDLGEDVARKILRNAEEYQLVGFIDDSKEKIGKRLHNFPILGSSAKLQEIIAKANVSELIIAISSLPGDNIRDLTRLCRKNEVACRIVPSFPNMLKQDVDIKNIDIADLLRRESKDLDEPQIRRFIKDKVIIITGAGGSIGSELARQCLRFGAKRLILVDHSEYNLYALQEELGGKGASLRFALINVLDDISLGRVLSEERPSVFFHAAAYKHVPIVEENPFQGTINNVFGTINTAKLAEAYGVEKYILISTDKAVRPTNFMGASKRVSELFIQNLNAQSRAEFLAVRFGNVLGSSGSVVPKFIDQINKGGPVTVTHPEVTRYFMLTSEAVQLVLQAASIGNGGEIFILNMGKPVRIAEMAEDLIFLSGRQPYKEIDIQFTGLRAGEKLYEELLHDESEKKTQYKNITIGKATYVDWEWLNATVTALIESCRSRNESEMFNKLKLLVPEFMHARFQHVSAEVAKLRIIKN